MHTTAVQSSPSTHLDSYTLEALLALRLAAGNQRDQLAKGLLACADPIAGLNALLSPHALPDGSQCEPLQSSLCVGPPSVVHWHGARRQRIAIETMGIGVVPVWRWPAYLRALTPLAPALFVRGDGALLMERGIGIVGSRRASAASQAWAAAWARHHAQQGALVISGGAMGIDAAAHAGALTVGGRTLAYQGTPVDRGYPAQNRALQIRIVACGGALVSEHPPGCRTFKSDHAMRNRFIAAHSTCLYIAEAALDSGSLGTAKWARRLGIPILVPPHGVGHARAGIEQLLQAGHAHVCDWPGGDQNGRYGV